MDLVSVRDKVHPLLYDKLVSFGIEQLRPSQVKAIEAELLLHYNVLVCTPTASGKTLIAEMGMVQSLLNRGGKAIYVAPLKALASEKFSSFLERYGDMFKIALSISDVDSVDAHLSEYDMILCTSEKLDALLRRSVPWLEQVKCVVVDEVHLLTDTSRGPTLEVVLTRLRRAVKPQIIALSATIGNPHDLAGWLDAQLIVDNWRPVELRKGVLLNNEITF